MYIWGHLIFGLVNLAILIILLVRLFKKPAREYLSSRSKDLMDRRDNAIGSLNMAEMKYKDNYERIQNIEEEMDALMKEAESDGESESRRLISEAEAMTERIIGQAMARADSEVREKNREFYREMVDKSIDEAGRLIKGRLDPDVHVSLGRDFLKRLCEKGAGNE